jgi:hypothetical protein
MSHEPAEERAYDLGLIWTKEHVKDTTVSSLPRDPAEGYVFVLPPVSRPLVCLRLSPFTERDSDSYIALVIAPCAPLSLRWGLFRQFRNFLCPETS